MIQSLQSISLASIAIDQPVEAAALLGLASAAEWILTVFAIVSLVTSAILIVVVSTERKRKEQMLNQKLFDVSANNAKLQQENSELRTVELELRNKIAELERCVKVSDSKSSVST
jgi:septal ring factor EnvC (AmiA/AmiB activator)